MWGEQQQAAFEALKAVLTEAPLLMLPRSDKPYEMHTDASDFAIGAVLHQKDAVNGELRPIAYESHKLSEAQRRYVTHKRELLAVVHALKVWRMYLVGCPVTVRTDHAALEWFKTQPKLTHRQARWSIAMQEHKVAFKYGRVNVVADALSRRPDLQVATATFEFRGRTPTRHLVDTGPPAPAELQLRRRSQSESIIIAECAPPALQVEASSQGAPAPAPVAQEAVQASTAAVSAAEPGTGKDTCDQGARITSDAAQIIRDVPPPSAQACLPCSDGL